MHTTCAQTAIRCIIQSSDTNLTETEMASLSSAIRHTTNTHLPLGKGEVHSSILCGSTSLKAHVIQAFFKRNTIDRLPYRERVGRKFGRSAVFLALAVGGCVHGDRNAAAREEYKARPACAGVVDAKAWTDCMERFKDVRPQHPPTALQFKDWRT